MPDHLPKRERIFQAIWERRAGQREHAALCGSSETIHLDIALFTRHRSLNCSAINIRRAHRLRILTILRFVDNQDVESEGAQIIVMTIERVKNSVRASTRARRAHRPRK